jgi:uncharacterized protein YjbJ (UPF0337 family)
MGFIGKMRNRFKMGKGRAKERAGRAAGDPYTGDQGRGTACWRRHPSGH